MEVAPNSLVMIDPELFQDDTHEEITREVNGVTFKTVNRLTFQARRQLTSLSCFASNKVLDEKKAIHLKRDTTINVKYKPVVEKLARIEMVNAVHGEPISLACRFTANPTAGVQVSISPTLFCEAVQNNLHNFIHFQEYIQT